MPTNPEQRTPPPVETETSKVEAGEATRGPETAADLSKKAVDLSALVDDLKVGATSDVDKQLEQAPDRVGVSSEVAQQISQETGISDELLRTQMDIAVTAESAKQEINNQVAGSEETEGAAMAKALEALRTFDPKQVALDYVEGRMDSKAREKMIGNLAEMQRASDKEEKKRIVAGLKETPQEPRSSVIDRVRAAMKSEGVSWQKYESLNYFIDRFEHDKRIFGKPRPELVQI